MPSSRALRSLSLSPPHTPCGSRIAKAYSKHSAVTEHSAQIAFARSSRSRRSCFRSNCEGGKKTVTCGPRQAPTLCQDKYDGCALTESPLVCADAIEHDCSSQGRICKQFASYRERCPRTSFVSLGSPSRRPRAALPRGSIHRWQPLGCPLLAGLVLPYS